MQEDRRLHFTKREFLVSNFPDPKQPAAAKEFEPQRAQRSQRKITTLVPGGQRFALPHGRGATAGKKARRSSILEPDRTPSFPLWLPSHVRRRRPRAGCNDLCDLCALCGSQLSLCSPAFSP